MSMSISTKIILADMLGSIDGLSFGVVVVCLSIIVVCLGIYMATLLDEDQADRKGIVKTTMKRAAVCLAVSSLVNILTPSRQVLAMAFAFEAVSEIKGMDKLPEKTIDALNTMLDEYIEHIKEDKGDEKN